MEHPLALGGPSISELYMANSRPGGAKQRSDKEVCNLIVLTYRIASSSSDLYTTEPFSFRDAHPGTRAVPECDAGNPRRGELW